MRQVVGIDRIMFSVDYPFSPNTVGRKFLDNLAVSPEDMEKITHRNAEKLLKLYDRPSLNCAALFRRRPAGASFLFRSG